MPDDTMQREEADIMARVTSALAEALSRSVHGFRDGQSINVETRAGTRRAPAANHQELDVIEADGSWSLTLTIGPKP